MYSIRSGVTASNFNSTIYTNRTVFAADTLRFYLKTSCQTNANHNSDYLEFLVNGFQRGRWDGETDWLEFSYPLEAGFYELAWRYHKDAATTAGDDCVWIDYLSLPPCNNPPVNVHAQMLPSGEVEIGWNPPADAALVTSYKIYLNGAFVATATATPYLINDTPIGNNSYRVSAMYTDIESPLSGIASLLYLPAPSELAAEVAGNQVILTWTEPVLIRSALGYRVYRNGNLWQFIDVNQNPSNTITDSPTVSGEYTYNVTLLYTEGESIASNPVTVNITVANTDLVAVPFTGIRALYPNPFTAQIQISFDLQAKSDVKLEVYNLKGQLVKQLIAGTMDKANHQALWDGTDLDEKPAAQGIYFVRLQSGSQQEIRKVMLMK
jgi:hypothetical protein